VVGCRLYHSGLGTKMVLAKHLTWRRDGGGGGGGAGGVGRRFGGGGGGGAKTSVRGGSGGGGMPSLVWSLSNSSSNVLNDM